MKSPSDDSESFFLEERKRALQRMLTYLATPADLHLVRFHLSTISGEFDQELANFLAEDYDRAEDFAEHFNLPIEEILEEGEEQLSEDQTYVLEIAKKLFAKLETVHDVMSWRQATQILFEDHEVKLLLLKNPQLGKKASSLLARSFAEIVRMQELDVSELQENDSTVPVMTQIFSSLIHKMFDSPGGRKVD